MQQAKADARRTVSIWSLISGIEATNWRNLLVCEHLDPWSRRAVFQTCRASASLLRMLPSSFRELYIDVSRLRNSYVEGLCLGAPLMCDAPFHIQVCGCDLGVVQATRLKMQQMGARDLVLVEAEHAAVRLYVAVDEDQPDMQATTARVQAVKSALLTRGNLPTKLHITALKVWQLSMAQGLLGTTTGLSELWLVLPDEQPLPTSILAAAAHFSPNLRVLYIDAAPEALPSPALFPKLELLSIHSDLPDTTAGEGQLQRILSTTRPYVKQLTDLTFLAAQALLLSPTKPSFTPFVPATLAAVLFNPAESIGGHLQHLFLSTVLDDTLLGLLLQCTPTLQELRVSAMRLESDAHAATNAAWQKLRVGATMPLSSLPRLPATAGLKLTLPQYVTCDISTPAAAAAVAAAVSRFREVAVQPQQADHGIALWAGEGVQVGDQPAALRVGLSLLRAVSKPARAQDERITLHRFTMNTLVILELQQGLPQWQVLMLGSKLRWLPAAAPYASLLRLLPGSFREVQISTKRLRSSAQIESICLGAPVLGQAPETPFHIKLSDCDAAVVAAIQHLMQDLGVYPNVVVSQLAGQ